MHDTGLHQRRGDHLWLIAGTGEGPRLAGALLARGWRLRVSLVGAAAARRYPEREDLVVEIGALAGEAAIRERLERARDAGTPFAWVVDATHPFARVISADLSTACRRHGQPLLRLCRPDLPPGRAVLLEDLAALADLDLGAERLLLAIGARRLGEALLHSNAKRHFARLLPNPAALRLARAAGLQDDQLACLHPGASAPLPDGALERALCRQWGITTVLARQSGGAPEALWHRVAEQERLRLLLLRRPPEPQGSDTLPLAELLEKLGSPPTRP